MCELCDAYIRPISSFAMEDPRHLQRSGLVAGDFHNCADPLRSSQEISSLIYILLSSHLSTSECLSLHVGTNLSKTFVHFFLVI